MTSLVVVNSGPLISLARVGLLDLLPRVFGRVVTPVAVVDEVLRDGGRLPGAAQVAAATWLEHAADVVSVERLLSHELGRGETQVIAYAVEHRTDAVLIDDRRARTVAQVAFGRPVLGTAGFLALAKRRGLLIGFARRSMR